MLYHNFTSDACCFNALSISLILLIKVKGGYFINSSGLIHVYTADTTAQTCICMRLVDVVALDHNITYQHCIIL